MERLRTLAMRAAPPLAVACAVLVPLAVHWAAGRTLVWFDTMRLYAPQRWIVDEALRAFHLPLWNPCMGGGMPFLADAIHGVLHPVSVLTAWIGTDRAVDVMIGGYVACAGLGAFALARELGASRSGAALAGLVYGTSGIVLSMAGNLVFLAGAGSLPFCMAGLRRFAADPRPASLALGVAGAAVLGLSGDAQTLIVGGVLALALAWDADGWRGAARAVAAGTVGLLVAAAQLVPSAVHLPRTVRAGGSWSPSPAIWAFEPWRLAELVLPGFLSGPDPLMDRVYEGLAGPGRWPSQNLPYPLIQSVFVGLLPMALAFAGAREGRRGRLLGALALTLLWIALGPTLGAHEVLRQVPIWRAFRYSEKLVGPLTLVLAMLAGLGLDAVVERRIKGTTLLVAATGLALASIAVDYLKASGLSPELASQAHARILRGTWHLLSAAGGLACWLLLRGRLGAARSSVALAALAWLGVAAASPLALHPGDPTARLRSPGPVLAAKAPGPRIVTPFTYEPLATAPGLDWIDQAARDHASKGYVAHGVRSRLDSLNDYEAMEPGRLARLQRAFGTRWPVAARRYGATHVVVDEPRSVAHAVLHAMATSGGERVEVVPGSHEVWAVPHREWAAFAPAVRLVGDERAAVTATARTLAEQSASVVVEALGRFDVAPGRILSLERGMESLRIEAEADADGTLVINDAWWPGWVATIDGVRVSIFPADALVRAVRWPAGRHVLEMRYRPPEVRTGLVVSGLGFVVLGGWMALLRRAVTGGRRSPSPARRPAPTGAPPDGPPAAASPPAP